VTQRGATPERGSLISTTALFLSLMRSCRRGQRTFQPFCTRNNTLVWTVEHRRAKTGIVFYDNYIRARVNYCQQ